MSYHATRLEALAAAVALPNIFTTAEMSRTLRRNNGDVMRAASQLKAKHACRTKLHYLELHVGLATLQEELWKGYAHFLNDANDTEHCPVLLLQLQYFKPRFGEEQKLQRQGCGGVDGSVDSSVEDARRLCVYLMDLAVEAMEAQNASGIVFIVDVGNCTLANLEVKMVTDLLQLCKQWYPEVVKLILVVNGSAFARVLLILLSKVLGPQTQPRIRVIKDLKELNLILPSTAIPQHYGGKYSMIHPSEWIKKQAELEDVEYDPTYTIDDEVEEQEKGFGLEEEDDEIDVTESLNGMQYATLSAINASEMPHSILRGSLMRKKMDAVWVKHFAVLRPDALLLYENATSDRPFIIIPVHNEVQVMAATFHDKVKGCGFRIEVPGVAGGHELVATSEQERGNWLQELQWAVNKIKEKTERREEREERRAKIYRDFEALEMINFNVDLPVAQSAKNDSGSSAGLVPSNTYQSFNIMGTMYSDNLPQAQQLLPTKIQSHHPLSEVALMDSGSYRQLPPSVENSLQRTVLIQHPMAFGMQLPAMNMVVQQQPILSMYMQPPMPMERQQLQPIQMGTSTRQYRWRSNKE